MTAIFKRDPFETEGAQASREELNTEYTSGLCEGNKKNKAKILELITKIPYVENDKGSAIPTKKANTTRTELCEEIKEAIKNPIVRLPRQVKYNEEKIKFYKGELDKQGVLEEKAELEQKVAFEEKAPEIEPRRTLYHTIKLINTADNIIDVITYSSQADGLIKASDAIMRGAYNEFSTDDPCLDTLLKLLILKSGDAKDGPEDTNLKMIKQYLEEASCNPELKSVLLRKKFPSQDSIERLSTKDKTILARILEISDISKEALFEAVQRKKVYPLHGLIRGPLFETHREFFELKTEMVESKYGERYQEELLKGNEFLIPTEDTVVNYDDTFDLYNITKDGNCLFTAMAGHLNAIRFMELTDWNQHHIRRNLVKFYKKTPLFRVADFYTQYGDGTRASYLKLLEEGCSSEQCGYDRYGTTMDVMAFAIMCKINVNIYYLDGFESCYYDTTEEELSERYLSGIPYSKRKVPTNVHKPMYIAFNAPNRHFDLLILKKGVSEPLKSTARGIPYVDPVTYIPFPLITEETIRSRIKKQREDFYFVLRQESVVGVDLSAESGAAGGSAGGARDDGFGQESGFPSVERMVRLKEQNTEPHAVTGLEAVEDFYEQDPDIMARMINCLM